MTMRARLDSDKVKTIPLAAVSIALLAVRLVAASRIGFGDSEALYACYARHPAPAYLDHPGLVGLFARAVGPTPERAHVATAILATAVPWLMTLACRGCGSTWPRALTASLVFALAPEIAVGLFAMTPDLLLAIAWTGALACAAAAARAKPSSARSAAAFAGAGLLAGVAAASKAPGALLAVSLLAAYASKPLRQHARTAAPWAGLVAGAIVVAPLVLFESRSGWPMLRHRLIDTQAEAGLSLRNAGALAGGQIAYLSPLVAVVAVLAAAVAVRDRRDAIGALLFSAFAVPLAALAPLCLWSRVAEPHWIAPALLALVPAAARSTWSPSRRLLCWSIALAAIVVAAAHAWALTPSLIALQPTLARELYGWPDVARAVREQSDREPDAAIVGPHWVVCAQLEATLRIPVGCDTPVRDDFDDWLPRDRWKRAETIVWVTDDRFGPPPVPATHAIVRTREVPIEQAGRVVRRFVILVLARRGEA